MALYEKFRGLNLDFSRLGLERGDARGGYFCTPVGAEVIGWEGVDGIHYCFIEGFEEMVFAVNPSALPGEYVHPLARSFEDFLRLLIACGSTAAAEQAHQWDREQFDAFVADNPPAPEIGALRDKLSLTPMDDPYGYIREVQACFDYSKIPFSDEYYENLPPEYQMPERPEWKVYFDGGFNGRHTGRGRPGKEIAVNKTFIWGGNVWHVPAVYICGQGLVVDLCMEIDPAALKAFIGKWAGREEEIRRFTPEEQEQWMAENPTQVSCDVKTTVNGRELRCRSGIGFGWTPDSCRPESERWRSQQDWEAIWLMEHYGLDQERGWLFNRDCFPWTTKSKPALKTLSLSLERNAKAVPGPRFTVSGVGDTVEFVHPVTGEAHTLRVVEYEAREMNSRGLPPEWEYPAHYTALSYTVEPELPREALTVRDRAQGDAPRPKPPKELAAVIGGADGSAAAVSVGIIGGADGPTAILLANGKAGRPRAACSALYFDPPEQVEWRMVFYQKTVEGMTVELLP